MLFRGFALQPIARGRHEAAENLTGRQEPSFCLAPRAPISLDALDQPPLETFAHGTRSLISIQHWLLVFA